MDKTEIMAAISAFKEATSSDVVSEELISKRSAVCRNCPAKKRVRGLASNMSLLLGSIANRHRVPAEIGRNMCSVCGCSLMLLLPAKKSSLHQDSPAQKRKRPFSCWFNWEE
jgi:hypothetical protein